jgi:hypothetical protein
MSSKGVPDLPDPDLIAALGLGEQYDQLAYPSLLVRRGVQPRDHRCHVHPRIPPSGSYSVRERRQLARSYRTVRFVLILGRQRVGHLQPAAGSRSLQARDIAGWQVDPAFNAGAFGLGAWRRRSGEAECGGASDQSADEGVEGVTAVPAAIQRAPSKISVDSVASNWTSVLDQTAGHR